MSRKEGKGPRIDIYARITDRIVAELRRVSGPGCSHGILPMPSAALRGRYGITVCPMA